LIVALEVAKDFVVVHHDGALPEAKIIARLKAYSLQTTICYQVLGAVGTVSDNGDLGLVARSAPKQRLGEGGVLALFAGALQLD
jgi:hypothetical protein